ncbi:hypothetical protein [Bosea sp. PAMC 26642]|uniref:hypothetical protein n=1 Tax=Bosea sp. (strain PAMC 26642) TaxID=1792307 RepID=UPI00077038B0|nr:hypothetical protein [Bosea sp. PAMC 26642]AMJ61801.1 hypothetical protein AXW83_17130 [Bosea sp. PAMC 26642]
MAGEKICFAALPGALPSIWPATSRQDAVSAPSDDSVTRKIRLRGLDAQPESAELDAAFLAPRVLPRLARQSGPASSAQTAYAGAESLIILLPMGRFDDGVWAPIIERLLAGAGAMRRETILAWAGIEPFLAPFGRRASEVWSDPRIVPGLLTVFERSARSLATIMRDLPSIDGAPAVRKGLIRVEMGEAGAPDRIALALA